MKIIEKIDIKNNSSIIYAKTILKNILKKMDSVVDSSFLILSMMELSTNLLKHANGGEIWILKSKSDIMIASLDYGGGIEDIEWSKQNGTTRMSNSLGIGLHQIDSHELYKGEIVSFTSTDMHGTIVLVRPRDLKDDIVSLQSIYSGELVCGDLFAKKGRFLLLADGSGHGKKANKSVEFIKDFFYNHPFSCMLIDDFLKEIHNNLKQRSLRGSVVSFFEILKRNVKICGVGNISIWVESKGGDYKYISQKDGILGEVFSSSSKIDIDFEQNSKVIAATDGIDIDKMNYLLEGLPINCSAPMIALSAMHFAPKGYDDRTIVIISKGG